jgi:hypothetical protein
LHEPLAEADAIPPGVVVVDASGVAVGGTSVGKDKPGLVGGRVEVTKAGGADVPVSCETLMHDPRLRLVSRMSIQIFFIQRFYLEIINLEPPRSHGAKVK